MSESTPATSNSLRAAPGIRDEPELECRHPGLLAFAIMMTSIMQLLDVTIANVALPHMRASLGATLETVSWVLTTYIVAGVMVTPIVGWCADRFGSRNIFLWGVAGFIVASMLCGAATSLSQMVVFRAIQGACAGFLAPMTQTILFDTTKPSQQARIMTLWGMTVMIAPIAGPTLGGFLTETLNWRWVFYVNVPVGIPTLLLLVWLLPTRPLRERKLDRFGYLSLVAGLVCLQLMLDRGQHKDWFNSWEIIVECGAMLSAFWLFFVHSRTAKHPLFPPVLFSDANYMVSLGIMIVLGVANVALMSVMPTMYQNVYDYAPIDTGLLIMPRGIGALITMVWVTRIMHVVDIRYLLSVGYFVASGSLFLMSGWSPTMGAWDLMYPGFIQGLGLGLIFTPMTMVAFSTIDPIHRPDASSLLNLMRNMGGSFGISIIFTLLSRNTQVSHADLAAHITSFSMPALDPVSISDRFADMGAVFMQIINGEISRQALLIAYLDNFYMVAIGVFVIGMIPFFLKPIRLTNTVSV